MIPYIDIPFTSINLYQKPVSARWGERKLRSLCRAELGREPEVNELFLFFNRARDTLKLFWLDEHGSQEISRMMPRGGFLLPAPQPGETFVQIGREKLDALFRAPVAPRSGSQPSGTGSVEFVEVDPEAFRQLLRGVCGESQPDGSNVIAFRPVAARSLERNRAFKPVAVEAGDELFANGIFEFNISKLLAHLQACPERFQAEHISLGHISALTAEGCDETAIATADLTQPIILAEISPGQFTVIDGHHRLSRARREGRAAILGYRVPPEVHTAFLTSAQAYGKYVEYWNSRCK